MKNLYIILLKDINENNGERILFSNLPEGKYRVKFNKEGERDLFYVFSNIKTKKEIEKMIEEHTDRRYFVARVNNRKFTEKIRGKINKGGLI
jgi:hypothetical protein